VTVSLSCDSLPASDAVGRLVEAGRLALQYAYKRLAQGRSTVSGQLKTGAEEMFPACQVPGAMRPGGQSSTAYRGR
jgi:hypothetical protein